MINKNSLFMALMLFILSGCTTFNDRVDVTAKRAAFDLSCSVEELTYSDLGPQLVGVTGCGKKATYVVQCSLSGANCLPPILNTNLDKK